MGLEIVCATPNEQKCILLCLPLPPNIAPCDSDNMCNVGHLLATKRGSDSLIPIDDSQLCVRDAGFLVEHSVVCQQPLAKFASLDVSIGLAACPFPWRIGSKPSASPETHLDTPDGERQLGKKRGGLRLFPIEQSIVPDVAASHRIELETAELNQVASAAFLERSWNQPRSAMFPLCFRPDVRTVPLQGE